MPSFGNNNSKITDLCENVYDIYSSNTENALNHFLNRLRFKVVLFTKEEQIIFKTMFSNITPTEQQKKLIDKLVNGDENIKNGIEKTKVDNNDSIDNNDNIDSIDSIDSKEVNYMYILKHIIPLICILTIHNKETSFIEMFKFIENEKYVYEILIDQTKSWWGKNIDSKIIKKSIKKQIKLLGQ